MIPPAPLPPPPFIPAPLPSTCPKDPVDPAVAAEQERIRADLDSRLPRWPGPAEHLGSAVERDSGIPGSGWWNDDLGPNGPHDWPALAMNILIKLKNYKDAQ